eukprot:309229-Pelagomonas_calceolata.AAC.3
MGPIPTARAAASPAHMVSSNNTFKTVFDAEMADCLTQDIEKELWRQDLLRFEGHVLLSPSKSKALGTSSLRSARLCRHKPQSRHGRQYPLAAWSTCKTKTLGTSRGTRRKEMTSQTTPTLQHGARAKQRAGNLKVHIKLSMQAHVAARQRHKQHDTTSQTTPTLQHGARAKQKHWIPEASDQVVHAGTRRSETTSQTTQHDITNNTT